MDNKKIAKHIFFGLLIIIGWMVMYGVYYQAHKGEIAQKAKLAGLMQESQVLPEIQRPVKFSDCQIRGALPDPECTPGDIFNSIPLETICTHGYTKTVRNVSLATKKKVYAMYGIAYPPSRGSYEMDHLIPLALGGNNNIANLFPEAAQPKPGFKEKDVVEMYLYQEVCAGHINLGYAQATIAKDWLAVYTTLDQATITAIKNKYKSWAN